MASITGRDIFSYESHLMFYRDHALKRYARDSHICPLINWNGIYHGDVSGHWYEYTKKALIARPASTW